MGTSKTIPINLEVTASLEGMNKIISDLQRGISQGVTKLDLTKGLGASLSKEIASFERDFARVQKLTQGGSLQLGDAKEFTKKSEHLLSTFEEIQRVIRNLDTLTVLDAKKLFPAAFDQRVESLKTTLSGLTESFDKLATKNISKSKLESDIASLETSVKELNELASKEAEYKLSTEQAQKRLQEADQKVEELRTKLKQGIELKLTTNSDAIKEAEDEIEKILKDQRGRKSTKEITDKPGQKLRYKGKTAAQWEGAKVDGRQKTAALKVLTTYEAEKQAIDELQEKLKQLNAEREKLVGASQKTSTKMGKAASDSGVADAKEVADALKEQKKASEDAEAAAKNLVKAQEAVGKAGQKQEELIQKQERLKKITGEIEALTKKVNFDSINKAFTDLNTALTQAGKNGINLDLTPDMLKSEEGIKKIRAALDQLDAEDLDKLKASLKELGLNADDAKDNVKGLQNGIDGVSDTAKTMNAAQIDMERLKDSMLHFFSLSNTIQLFKRTVRDAINTVKELDAAMTETAVVTDFSIGDMWDKLPEYSDEANKLGASIKDLYNATTLYYQQGLKGAEVMDVGVETMKMARIAGMDATEATKAMTAALRGFNMEINEMSATRINDVYSELAAITAADTNQIATAMTKTASIAASANMEFETTAALLAQIIETTQEAPETAGTAMKTIIARFTEVKELFNEGMLTGKDDEGEEININKIDAALKSVGISLKDFLNGTKGIDDIFLELASKWDSLDLATQRYIATTAAGSRQQSRFLAMMSNYDRTMELVNAATNSAGASQKQFDKTTESLAAKLQRLKNAWDTFAMGLADSDVIKGAVDLITNLLTTINNLTDVGEGKIGGFITTILRLGTVLLSLKAGQGALNGFLKILDKSGAAKIFGLNMTDIGKVDFTGALGGTFKTLGKTIAKYNNWDAVGNMATSALTKIKSGISIILQPLKQFASLISAQAGLWAKLKVIASPVLKLLLTGIKALFSPLGVLLISLTAITAAIVGIRKAYQEAEESFKLEQVNEEIEGLKEKANEARTELEEITNEKNNLETLQTTFKNLTKGTDEWKRALVSVNQEVLSLVEKYPELQATIGKDGQLEIDSKSWDNLLAKQAQVISNIGAQQIDANSRRQEILSNIAYEDFAIKVIEIRDESEGTNLEAQLSGAKSSDAFENWIIDALGENAYRWFMELNDLLANDAALDRNAARLIIGGELEEMQDHSDYAENRIEGDREYYEEEVYERAVQLDQDQVEKLANYFADNNLTDLTSTDTLRAGLEHIGITSEEEIEGYIELFGRIMEDAEHPFYELVGALQESSMAEKNLATQFATNAIGATSVGEEEYADSIANIIANEISRKDEKEDTISEQVDNKIEQIRSEYSKNGKLDEEKIAAAYADIMGYQSVNGEVYTDGTYSQRVETSAEAMLRAIATEKVTVEVQEKSAAIGAKVESKEEQQQRLFDDLFGGIDGSNITGAQRQKYYKNGEVDFDQLAKDLGVFVDAGEEAFVKLGEEFEILPEDLKAMMESNFEKSEIRAKKQRSNTANSIAQYATGTKLHAGNIYGSIEKIEKNFTNTYSDIEVRDMLDSALSALSKTGDNKLIQNGILELMDAGLANDIDKFTEISQFIDKVNWNDPVEAVSRLNREIKIGSGASKEFAQNLLDLNSSYLGDASQFKAFLNSDEYVEISDKLAEIKETQGEITAADVDELASEYSYLNKMIKNTQMSSKSLASVLDDITDGTLAFEDINDVLIAGIKYLGSFEDSLDSILEHLNNFDPGRDEGEAQDFLDTASEVITEKVENYEYGNTQARSYITEMLGEDYLKGTVEQQVAAMEAAKTFFESISGTPGAGMQVFKNIADGKDIMGNAIAGGQQKIDGIDYGYNDQGNFYMDIDASKYKTLEEVTQAFADSNLGGSKTLWDTMFTLMSNFDPGFMQDWEVEQAGQAGARMREEAIQIDGKAIVSEKTIKDTAEKLHEAVGDVTGKSVEDFIKDIHTGLGEYQTFDVLNADGTRKELQVLKGEIEALFGSEEDLLSRYIGLNDDGISTFDFTGLANGLQTLGLTAEESLETTYSYIQNLPKEVKKINIDGQEVNLFDTDGDKKSLDELKEEVENLKNAAEVESTISINTATATSKVRSYIEELNAIPRDIVTSVSVEQTGNTQSDTGGNSNGGGGKSKLPKAATGTINHPRSEMALTGEEGPELVETKKGAYLVGTEGPQMAYINKGDTVHTAKETEEIYKRKGVAIKAYGRGQDGTVSSILDLDKIIKGGSGGANVSSKSNDDKEDWENSFDKLYNLVREIDEELRRRERLERRYEKLLESVDLTADKLFDNSVEQLKQLEKEKLLSKELQEARRSQIQQYQQENADLMKYAKVVQNERGEDILRIHWDQIDLVEDPEQGQRIEDYVSQLEEWFDSLEEAEDKLNDIEDRIEEVKELGKEEYLDFENAVKDAITFAYQEEIDKLSEINESINDTNTQLIDAISKQVNRMRQQRENERTEQELQEKQRQLLYLSQDTSGANDVAILELQREIEEGTVDYTDTLIDQKIDELQMQNDEAAQQREQQITLMQAQLDHLIQSGEIWDEVYSLMDEGLDPEAGLLRGSRLEQILKNAEGFQGMSKVQQMDWLKELQQQAAQAVTYMRLTSEKINTAVELNRQNYFGGTTPEPEYNGSSSGGSGGSGGSSGGGGLNNTPQNNSTPKGYKVTIPAYGGFPGGTYKGTTASTAQRTALDAIQGFQRTQALKISQMNIPKTQKEDKISSLTATIKYLSGKANAVPYYLHGGLADFTGPAWLDGTKTRPELVLNARDTQNFIQLKDILASVMNRGINANSSTENNGDITYDIDINVESIGSDYDVEQVANKVKSMINDNARYRNNNTVSLAR